MLQTLGNTLATAITTENSGYTATFSYAPDYTLPSIKQVKVVVVPADYGITRLTRGKHQRTFVYEIGFLKQVSNESEVGPVIEKMINVGNGLLSRRFDSFVVQDVKTVRLYDPQEYKNSRKVVSVIQVTLKEW